MSKSTKKGDIGSRRYTVMVVPSEGRGGVWQRAITLSKARWWVTGALVLALLALVGVVLSVLAIPQRMSMDRLVEENLILRSRLGEIESTLNEVEAELERLRLYESQLEGLTVESLPGFGPLDDEDVAWASWMGLGTVHDSSALAMLGAWGDPMDELSGMEGITKDAESTQWAEELQYRTEAALEVAREAEVEVGHMVESVELFRATQAAIPTAWPVDGSLTSGFGLRRSPINRKWKFHSGIDISAPRGTPVVAPAGGMVREARYSTGYGRLIEIDHGFGIVSRFAHNSRTFVKKGNEVEQGQVIATVGMTGQTTGPHLHYEVLMNGRPVDPLEYLE